MLLFEWTLVLLLVAVLLAALARRLEVPYPSLLAVVGAVLAFLPFSPAIEIDPELALALFVAPVLLDAAFDTSPRDLKRNALPLTSLAVVAVMVTTAAVALIGWKFAGLPLAAAIALGAIVAPPDAAAAAAVLSQFRPPRRIMAVLQGESLLNDATALLIYRVAVVAAGGTIVLGNAVPIAALSLIGSIVAGYVLARLFVLAITRVTDAATATILQFVGTFGVWIFADRVGLSGIVTMVVYAITLARSAPRRTNSRNRVSSYSVWETAVFVLNVLAFVLMGLQAKPILNRLSEEGRVEALLLGLATLVTVIVIRLAWVLGAGAIVRLTCGWLGPQWHGGKEGVRGDLLMGWCGMRGLVTLATAFALPADFPGRDPIVLTAFCVVLGTLVLQGMTLKPLLRMLNFAPDQSIEQEVSRGRVAVMQAALDSLAGDDTRAAAAVRDLYAAARTVAESSENPQAATEHDELRLRAIKHQRAALERLRHEGTIGDEAYHRLQEEIDWSELDASPAGRFQPLMT
ncbi:MAG TPA: sodium:proton antiporter [Xanthobacteraceae bacterium]|nr:sodium:proton antiporter [Xanthobacteraceae bacterium]